MANKDVNEMFEGGLDEDYFDALEELEDQSKESTFEKELPAAGVCLLRMVSYIELGKHTGMYKGVTKKNPDREVKITFEIVSDRHTKGKENPVLISLQTLAISTNAKAKYHKLFKAMVCGDGEIKHLTRCLGKGYLGKIFHETYTNKQGKEVTTATLVNPDTKEFAIYAPEREDVETGEVTKIKVPQAKSKLTCFVWSKPLFSMWKSIYIDGTTDDGRSKNWMQERCLEAEDFQGSPLQAMLIANNQPTEAQAPAPEEKESAPAVEEDVKASKKASQKKVVDEAPEAAEEDEAPAVASKKQAKKVASKSEVVEDEESDDNDDLDAMARELGLTD